MTRYETLLFAISVLGAFNALLATALWFAPDRRSLLADFWPYPALTAIVGVVILLIGGDHSGVWSSLTGLEWLLGAGSGALLVDAVSRSVGRGSGWRVYVLIPVILVGAIILSGITGYPTIALVVLAQIGFTLFGAWLWIRTPSELPSRRAAFLVVVTFAVLHIAQIMRMAFPALLRDFVPILLATAFVALTTLLLLRSRALTSWFREIDRSGDAATTLGALTRWLETSSAFTRSDLRLTEAAAALDLSEETLSKRLNDQGRPFPALLTDLRLDAAAARLRDPAESRTSVEAIGLLSGFSSRSGFYKAFNRRFGETPASYRRQKADSCPPGPERTGK